MHVAAARMLAHTGGNRMRACVSVGYDISKTIPLQTRHTHTRMHVGPHVLGYHEKRDAT